MPAILRFHDRSLKKRNINAATRRAAIDPPTAPPTTLADGPSATTGHTFVPFEAQLAVDDEDESDAVGVDDSVADADGMAEEVVSSRSSVGKNGTPGFKLKLLAQQFESPPQHTVRGGSKTPGSQK